MSRAPLYRALIALAVVAASLFFAVTSSARLGLDLRGGTQIVLETQDSPTVAANAESTDRALEVLRRRVDALGVAEPTLARSGDRRIIIELPGVQDPTEAAEVIGRTAQLTFHPVLGYAEQPAAPEPTTTAAPTGTPAPPGTPAPTSTAAPAPPGTPPPTAEPTGTPSAAAAAEPAIRPVAFTEPLAAPAAENTPATEPAPTAAATTGATPAATPATPGTPAATPAAPGTPAPTAAPGGELVLPDEDGAPLRLGPAALTGEGVSGADPANDPQLGPEWFVTIDFQGEGGNAWEELTGTAACAPPGDPARRVAIVLDNEVISSPQVDESLQCEVGLPASGTRITGNFTIEEARELAVLIEGGALPVPVEIISQSAVGATLGDEAIDASARAAVIGIALTGLFILAVYRLMGLLATIALACYALISYAVLVAIGATLTLPGLAGFVLAIGMAIDANVLVFERAREEYRGGKAGGMRTALSTGFTKAWSAIIDSNVTTLLAAGLLFFLASGPVRGFGVTLTIGVLASMVSALLIARVLTEWAVRRSAVASRPKITGLSDLGAVRTWLTARNPDIMGRTRLWLGIAAGVVVLAVAGIAIRGLNLGVEFTGGRLVEYSTSSPVAVDDARQAVSDAGFPRAVVQESGEGNISVRGALDNQEETRVEEALADVAGGVTPVRDELIGPSLGDELRRNALIALGVALLAQMLYLAVRFRWTFGVAAVLAMFHDVALVVGIFAWLGKPIDGVFLAAALTIIGLSVNDTVVVFDRVRELWRDNPKLGFRQVANRAVLQTVPRTVNTGLGAMFILAALAVLGGDSLTDFAIALLLGLLVGTYSSVFIAAPLAVEMQKRWQVSAPAPKRPTGRRPVRAPGDTGAVV